MTQTLGPQAQPYHNKDTPQWASALVTYLQDSKATWGSDLLQQHKLEKAIKKFSLWAQIPRAQVADHIARLRRRQTLPVVRILNIGGCGSHWLASMIEQCAGLLDCGEVYLPDSISKDVVRWERSQANTFIDAIEFLHAFLKPRIPGDKELVYRPLINSAHGIARMRLLQKTRLKLTTLHLYRDPRDRTLSVSLRKAEYRAYTAPEASDDEYLVLNAKRTASHHRRYSGLARKADLEVAYERLREQPVLELKRILSTCGLTVSDASVADIVDRSRAEKLAANDDPKVRGNFSGNVSGWRTHPDEAQLKILHPYLADTIMAQKYQLCDCFGRHSVPIETWHNISLEISDALRPFISIVGFSAGKYWSPAATGRLIGRGRVRLRMQSDFDLSIATTNQLGSITDVCAAGTSCAALGQLLASCTALQSLDLRLVGNSPPPQAIAAPGLIDILS